MFENSVKWQIARCFGGTNMIKQWLECEIWCAKWVPYLCVCNFAKDNNWLFLYNNYASLCATNFSPFVQLFCVFFIYQSKGEWWCRSKVDIYIYIYSCHVLAGGFKAVMSFKWLLFRISYAKIKQGQVN